MSAATREHSPSEFIYLISHGFWSMINNIYVIKLFKENDSVFITTTYILLGQSTSF
jgi:hypothetical protein